MVFYSSLILLILEDQTNIQLPKKQKQMRIQLNGFAAKKTQIKFSFDMMSFRHFLIRHSQFAIQTSSPYEPNLT